MSGAFEGEVGVWNVLHAHRQIKIPAAVMKGFEQSTLSQNISPHWST